MYSWRSDGQPLVEVFGVRFLNGGEAPEGTVSVFDGKRAQIIYNGHKPSSCRRRSGGLALTGPYHAVSADGSVAFVLDLHHRGDNNAAPSSEILVDVYDEATRYDELTTRSDGRGAEVTYALLSDAVEATVKVRLLGERAGRTVGGTVVARTDLGEVVLFDADSASVGSGTEEEPAGVVPLTRSVLAVPLASVLTIVVDLAVHCDDGREEVVIGSVVSAPKLGGEDLPPGPAAVEVKVTWLD